MKGFNIMFGEIAILLLLCLITAQAFAGVKAKLNCGKYFISGGENYMFVRTVCGEPTIERSVDRGKRTDLVYAKGQKHYFLTFVFDRLVKVEMKIIR